MRLASLLNSLFYFVALKMLTDMQACDGCLEKERIGLLEIKTYFVAQDSHAEIELASWVDDRTSNCCAWDRVKCSNNSPGHIMELSLRELQSHSGQILNASLFRPFEGLLNLDLSNNSFYGYTEGLCEMRDLIELDISGNKFSGELAECLGNLTNIQILDLSNNLFNGSFPSFITNLTSLQYLSLFGNYLQGTFSLSNLANHSKLQVLYISSQSPRLLVQTEDTKWFPTFQLKSLILRSCNLNMDKGSIIPRFLLHQSDLQLVDLSYNNLVGAFPSWLIHNNPRLITFFLTSNSLEGNLQLSPIKRGVHQLDISNNSFSGVLPSDIGIILPNVTYLNMSKNKYEGNIPATIGEMKELVLLDLSQNHFTGKLPEQLATNCTKLVFLILSNNFLQGNISKASNWTNLLVFYLKNNNFSGTLEEVIGNKTSLEMLDISNNSISGAIPYSIVNFSSLRILLLAENYLEGEIPFGFFNKTCLEILDLSQNRLFGSFSYFSLPNLRYLYLQKNAFSGSIPFSLSKSSKLKTLDLRDNYFSGNVPFWMDELSKLRVLLLGGNNFEGNIPIQLCQLKNVMIMDISSNMINGSIPPCFKNLSFGNVENDDDGPNNFQIPSEFSWKGLPDYSFLNADVSLSLPLTVNLVDRLQLEVEFRTKSNYYSYKGSILENMTGLDLSCNRLTGNIPSEIGNLQQILDLNLSHNFLLGSIPDTFSNLTQIESLDLSYNHLIGELPFQLTGLNFLSIFNVSYNNLSGIPPSSGQFANFDEDNYRGNPNLCGPLLKKKCEGFEASHPSQSLGNETAVDMVAFYWSFIAAYITIILGFITVLCINAQWRLAWFHFINKVIHTCFYRILKNVC